MRSSFTSSVFLVGLATGLVSLYGCSSGGGNNNTGVFTGTGGVVGTGTAGSNTGAAGSNTGAAGSNTTGTAGSNTGAAGSNTSGIGGTTGAAGEGTAGGSGGSTGAAGSGAAGSTTGGGGTGASSDITKVVAAGTGCGKAPPAAYMPGKMSAKQSIMVMGTKDAMCADAKCGAWTDTRNFFVTLPANYDMNKPYPILWEGPGCGGGGNNQYALTPAFNNSIITIGVSPSAYWQAYHATNPGQGCFDDKEGDDSVDWVLYEALYDQLASTICFDRNRVFAGGNSSGAWFSNEIGCKYAGDAKRPVRAISPNTGGLPTDPKYVPTCTTKPMAGFWSHEINDGTNPFTGNIVAMNRALGVNGCTPAGVTYATAAFDPFPIGGGVMDGTCKKYKGCPDLYPLVVCPLPGNQHAGHDNIVNPGWSTFYSMFSMGSLISQ